MANYPTQLDEIDQWLFDSFGIVAGACSSTENLRHNTARMIAEALWPKCKESLHIPETCKENGSSFTDETDSKKDSGDSKLSKDLEKAAEEYAYNNWQSDDYHIGASEGLPFDAIGHTEACFKAGAKWQREQDIEETLLKRDQVEGPSRDQVDKLKEAAEEYAKDETMSGLAERAFKDGANWQREQLRDLCYQCEKNGETIYYRGMKHAVEQMEKENKETIELAEDHAMLAGMVKKEEEIREKALELTVYLDDDGYPCIPEIVLFDFDKNQPAAKEGDKVKVYIFRDNKE